MGMSDPVLRTWDLVVVLLCCCCLVNHLGSVEASHEVHLQLQSVEPPSVNPKHRTGYHFQPHKNWINDPNAPMYYNGVYHFFYQYNPKGAIWGDIVWAHSVSTDLINWKLLPPAIYPSKPFDIHGCWSGSATVLPSGNKLAILYTGVDVNDNQIQNIAFPKNLSDPYLVEWTKPDYNPIIFPQGGVNASAFRDPTTAWYGPDRHFRIVIGSKRKHRGMAIMYRSRDFKNWIKAKHPLHSAPNTGMWECPDFFPLATRGKKGLDTSVVGAGVKHVFKVSLDLTRYEYYTVGTYDLVKDKYVPDNTSADDHTGLRYDYGNFYASKTFFDPQKNRRILWGWSNESDSKYDDIAKGWAGVQAIPRTMWLDDNRKQVVQWPIEELETLRQKQVEAKNIKLKSGGFHKVDGIQTHEADVEVTFDVSSLEKAEPFDQTWTDPQVLCGQKPADVKGGVGPFGLLALASSDLREQTAVFFRLFKAQEGKHVVLMCHDISRSSLLSSAWKPAFGGFVDVDIAKEGKISLRSLIDNSVVESFGGEGKTVITSRVYPILAEGSKAHLFAFNNGTADVKISKLQAWEMKRPLMN